MKYPLNCRGFQEEARTPEEAKRMLVMSDRVLAHLGVFDAFGHISVRNPENPDTFFISRAISPELVTMDDIVELDFEGNMVSGDPTFRTFSERAIHCAIYEARPDVNCVSHPHPHEILPFASTDAPLVSIGHQNVTFYDGIPTYDKLRIESGMLVNTLEQGRELAAELGDKRGIMIRNHGIVVVGESIPRTVYSTVTIRDNAKVLLQAYALGHKIKSLSREEMESGTYQQFCGGGISRSWNYWCTKAKQAYPDLADFTISTE